MKTYIIAEIGINHNGSLENAKKLIDIAALSGCDAVKFQKRNPDVCVPEHQKGVMRCYERNSVGKYDISCL
jgi:N-acetylneuraminate synthase